MAYVEYFYFYHTHFDDMKTQLSYLRSIITITRKYQEFITLLKATDIPKACCESMRESMNEVAHLDIAMYLDMRVLINSVYLDQSTTWYEIKSHKPVLNRQIFGLLTKAIEISGVVGLDRLFSFMMITNLQKIKGFLQNKNEKQPTWYSIISTVQKDIKSAGEAPCTSKFYQNCVNRTTKLWPEFLDSILIIGQLQLARQLIAFHLNLLAKFNARNLEAALQSLSKALLWDIKYNEDWTPNEKLLHNLSHYFDYAGINNPFNKIYIASSSHLDYTITIFIFFISYNMKLFHPGIIGNLGKRPADQLDGYCFCLGVHTVLKQFHDSLNDHFIKLVSKYSMDLLSNHKRSKNPDLCMEAICAMNFLQTYSKFSEASAKSFKIHFPEELLHMELTPVLLNI